MTPGPHVGTAHILASTFPPERRADPLDELIPVGGDSEKISHFDTLWEAENFVLNKTKGGELLVRVYCETGDTRTAKIESFFSGLFATPGRYSGRLSPAARCARTQRRWPKPEPGTRLSPLALIR